MSASGMTVSGNPADVNENAACANDYKFKEFKTLELM